MKLLNASNMRYDLQGLRGVAVLLVILSHSPVSFFKAGFVGVDVFFVISGFFIVKLLMDKFDADGRIRLRDFYAKRVRRIIPAASVVILTVMVVAFFLYGSVNAVPVFVEGFWSTVFVSNFFYAVNSVNYFTAGNVSLLANFWSLSVEEQFYIVLPVLVVLSLFIVKSRKMLFVVLCVAFVFSFVYGVFEGFSNPGFAYFDTFARVWEFVLGGLVALMLPRLVRMVSKKFSVVLLVSGLVLILGSLFVLYDVKMFPSFWALIPTLGAVFVIISGVNGYSFVNPLKSRVLVWFGFISFSLYLWYYPVQVMFTNFKAGNINVLDYVLMYAGIIVLAWVTTRFVENPVRNNSFLKARPFTSILAGLTAILLTLTVVFSFIIVGSKTDSSGQGFVKPSTVAELQRQILSSVDTTVAYNADTVPQLYELDKQAVSAYQYECLNKTETSTEVLSSCVYGDREASTTVAVFGDSVAASWIPALDIAGVKNKFKVLLFAKTGCPPITSTVYSNVLMQPSQACNEFKNNVLKKIAVDKNITTVVLAGLTAEKYTVDVSGNPVKDEVANLKNWAAGYQGMFTQLKALNVQPILLGSTPVFTSQPKDCISLNTDNVNKCYTSVDIVQSSVNMEKSVAAENNVPYVDVLKLFCNETVCPIIVNNEIVFSDKWHPSTNYVQYVSNPFTELFYDAVTTSIK